MKTYYEVNARSELKYMDLEYPSWRTYKNEMLYILENATKAITIQDAYHKVIENKRKKWWKFWIK